MTLTVCGGFLAAERPVVAVIVGKDPQMVVGRCLAVLPECWEATFDILLCAERSEVQQKARRLIFP